MVKFPTCAHIRGFLRSQTRFFLFKTEDLIRRSDVTGFKFFCFPLAACATQKQTSHASAKYNNFRILGIAC